MKKRSQRTLGLVLALAMVLSLLPVYIVTPVAATEETALLDQTFEEYTVGTRATEAGEFLGGKVSDPTGATAEIVDIEGNKVLHLANDGTGNFYFGYWLGEQTESVTLSYSFALGTGTEADFSTNKINFPTLLKAKADDYWYSTSNNAASFGTNRQKVSVGSQPGANLYYGSTSTTVSSTMFVDGNGDGVPNNELVNGARDQKAQIAKQTWHTIKLVWTPAVGETAATTTVYLDGVVTNVPTVTADLTSVNALNIRLWKSVNEIWLDDIKVTVGDDPSAEPEKFELNGATVDLGNSLDMNFYIDPVDLDANEDYIAKIVRSYADGRANEELTVSVDKTKIDSTGYIYVTYGNIAAKEMGDEIAVTIYDSEGNAVSETWTDSVKEYAERALITYQNEAETVAVLKDLLNYGAAAQAEFGYAEENPVDNDLTDIRSIAVDGAATANDAKKGTTLTLKSNILMEMFFFKDKVGEATTATVSYTNHRGTVVTEEVSLIEDSYYLDAYKVQIEGLVIADINTEVTVTIGDIEVTDTMAWFVKRSADADIYSAILALGDSAYNYFH